MACCCTFLISNLTLGLKLSFSQTCLFLIMNHIQGFFFLILFSLKKNVAALKPFLKMVSFTNKNESFFSGKYIIAKNARSTHLITKKTQEKAHHS